MRFDAGKVNFVRQPRFILGSLNVQNNPAAAMPEGSDADRATDAPAFVLVRDDAGLAQVVAALDEAVVVGLDIETTGLDPHVARVRLLSLSVETNYANRVAYLIDCFALDPSAIWPALDGKTLVIHNAGFDLAFLARLGFQPSGLVHDTLIYARMLAAGTMDDCGLAACSDRCLGRTLDKSLQRADWAHELADDQLAYAARDVDVLAPLLDRLQLEIDKAKMKPVADIERRSTSAIAWMTANGVALDRAEWMSQARQAEAEAIRVRDLLDAAAPARPDSLLDSAGWNWDSQLEIKAAFKSAGVELADTADDTLAALDHPLADLLRSYRESKKQSTAFGEGWLKHVRADGRVYPHWNQLGASSGRMSCSDPNLQQLPRGACRRCIVAPPGRMLVKADYSQIELRIAAKVSGDKAMLDAFTRGDDLHALTARSVLGMAEVSKRDRQLAKALNFGLLYGMGAEGFRRYAKSQYTVDLSLDDALKYRNAFFAAYPGLAAWHRKVGRTQPKETRTLIGRRMLCGPKTPYTVLLNTPVQGTGADGLKLALALLWERRDEMPGCFPVLAVHDEIVLECAADQAEPAAGWLQRAMIEAMSDWLAPVPVAVETKVGRTWAG